MKKTKLLFCFVMVGWATGAWGLAKSLLKPAEMPKVFADASFEERMQVLAEGYGEVATEYDENGVCVSGCAYKGMRIEDEERMIVRATDELRSLIEMENARMGYDPQQIQALQQQYLQQLQQKAQADAQAAGVQLEASGQAVAQQSTANWYAAISVKSTTIQKGWCGPAGWWAGTDATTIAATGGTTTNTGIANRAGVWWRFGGTVLFGTAGWW